VKTLRTQGIGGEQPEPRQTVAGEAVSLTAPRSNAIVFLGERPMTTAMRTDDSHREPNPGERRMQWLLVGHFLTSATNGLVLPFMTIFLTREAGLSAALAGTAVALTSWVALASAPLGGSLADSAGRKPVLLASLALAAAATLGVAFVSSPGAIVALLLLFGFARPAFRTAVLTIVADLFPEEEQARAYSMVRLVGNAGFAVGPAVGGYLAAASYRALFASCAAGHVAFCLLAALAIPETRPEEMPADPSTAGGRPSFRRVLSDRSYLAFCALFALSVAVWGQLFTTFPLHLTRSGTPENVWGLLIAVNAVMVVTLQIRATRIVERFPLMKALAVGSLAHAAGMAVIAHAASIPSYAAAVVLITAGELIVIPLASVFAASSAPAGLRGRYLGTLIFARRLGFGIGPMAGGIALEYLAGASAWWAMAAAGTAVAVAFYVYGIRYAPARAEKAQAVR